MTVSGSRDHDKFLATTFGRELHLDDSLPRSLPACGEMPGAAGQPVTIGSTVTYTWNRDPAPDLAHERLHIAPNQKGIDPWPMLYSVNLDRVLVASRLNGDKGWARMLDCWRADVNGPAAAFTTTEHTATLWDCPTGKHEPSIIPIDVRIRQMPCWGCLADMIAKRPAVESCADHPAVASTWADQNLPLRPDMVPATLETPALFFDCPLCGTLWYTSPNLRTRGKKTGCPGCIKRVSKPEALLYLALQRLLPSCRVQDDKQIAGNRGKTDIVLPDAKIAIEYDGVRWHRGQEKAARDARKDTQRIDHGWTVIRVREAGLESSQHPEVFDVPTPASGDVTIALTVLLGLLEHHGVTVNESARCRVRSALRDAEEDAERIVRNSVAPHRRRRRSGTERGSSEPR